MPGTATKLMTVEEFFVWQQAQDDRYELVEGVPLKRLRVSTQHDRIVGNIIAAFGRELQCSRYWPATAGLLLRTKPRTLRRADVLITADEPRADIYEARIVKVVVEVLAQSETGDGGIRRFDEFRRRNDVEHVVMISPERADTAIIQRDGGSWVSLGATGVRKGGIAGRGALRRSLSHGHTRGWRGQ